MDDSVATTTTDCGSKPETSSADSSMEIAVKSDEKKATENAKGMLEEADKKCEVIKE